MQIGRYTFLACVLACNGSIDTSTDAGDSGAPNDATIDVAKVSDAFSESATDGGATQCAFSIPKLDDAGVCHGGGKTIDCVAQDPSFDRCVAVQLHDREGGAFES